MQNKGVEVSFRLYFRVGQAIALSYSTPYGNHPAIRNNMEGILFLNTNIYQNCQAKMMAFFVTEKKLDFVCENMFPTSFIDQTDRN